jgi:hypothetical protein
MLKWAEVSEMRTASINHQGALMMEAILISEISVCFNVTTRRYIPEDSKLHTRRRENLKSHWHVNCIYILGLLYIVK